MISYIMALLLPQLKQLQTKSEKLQKDGNILTYLKFLEVSVIILKDYEYINTIGIQLIIFMELSINQKKPVTLLHEQEVSYKIHFFLRRLEAV